jgi:hypothetical protein
MKSYEKKCKLQKFRNRYRQGRRLMWFWKENKKCINVTGIEEVEGSNRRREIVLRRCRNTERLCSR